MSNCYNCSTELDDTNWMPSFKNRDCRICKSCYRDRFNSKNNKVNNPKALYINGKYISRKDPRYKIFKPGNYKNINDAMFESSAASTIKDGYVYIITNRAWPDWVKIGMAIDAEDRLNGYQTSSPMRDYVLEYSVYSNDRRASEQEAHTKATKICIDSNGEWFKMTVEQAKHILDNLNEQHNGLPKETSEDKKEDKLQKRSQQDDLWSYAENKEAKRAS